MPQHYLYTIRCMQLPPVLDDLPDAAASADPRSPNADPSPTLPPVMKPCLPATGNASSGSPRRAPAA